MNVSIGSDHRGIAERQWLAEVLTARQYNVIDRGTHSTESCDYPDIAALVSRDLKNGSAERGVLLCGTGIGMAMAANKFGWVRAAVVHDTTTAEMSRRHNNANVLCLSADAIRAELDAQDPTAENSVEKLVQLWFETEFEAGRHARRTEKMSRLAAEA